MLHENAVEPGTLELLKRLQKVSVLDDFHLAGGTALALHIGHRWSVDLDLFTLKDFDVPYIVEFLEESFNFYSDHTSANTIRGSIQTVKTDLIAHKYQLVDPIVMVEGIRLYSIADIAAMKLNAIAGNGTRLKDFADIYYILQQYSLADILDFYKIKYQQRNVLHLLKSLVWFNDINYTEPLQMIRDPKPGPETIKAALLDAVKNYSQQLFDE